MNHNGVISLPSDGATAYLSGEVVSINSSGQAVGNAAAKGLGVVLQDVDATETDRPIDIQLFSGGGMALVMANGSGTPIAVGDNVGFANGAKVVIKNGTTAVGYATEATSSATGLIRVIICQP